MIQTTEGYKSAVKKGTRSSASKIFFGVYDVTAKSDAVPSATTSQPFTTIDTIKEDNRDPEFKVGTFEDDYFRLDGTFNLMPDDVSTTDKLGWWSGDMSNENGDLLGDSVWINPDDADLWAKVNATVTKDGGSLSPDDSILTDRINYSGTTTNWDIVYQGRFTGDYEWSAWLKTTDGTNKTVYLTWGAPELNNRIPIDINGQWNLYKATVSPIDHNVHLGNHGSNTPAGWSAFSMDIWNPEMREIKHQTITVDFSGYHSSMGLGLFFGTDDCPSDFEITWYDGATVLSQQSIVDNTKREFNISNAIDNYDKIVVTISKMSKPYRYARLMEMRFGLEEIFDNNNIISASIVEEFDPSGGVLSVNSLKVTVLNEDQKFNMLNPDGVYSFLQKRQKIVAQSGLLISDGNYEYVPMGTYYLSDWKNSNGLTATLEATDVIGLLDRTIYHSSPFWVDEPIQNVLQHVLDDAGSFTLEVDPSVSSEVVNGYIPVSAHREAIADILISCRVVLRINRENVLTVLRPEYVTPLASVDYDTMIGSPSIEQKPLITGVEAEAYTYNLSTTVSQLHESTFELVGTETMVIPYDKAASNASVSVIGSGKVRYIRDWLNGSTSNTSNHWVEIKANDLSGTNVALNKPVTGSVVATETRPYSIIVDGDTASTPYAQSSQNGLQYVEVDLGSVYDIQDVLVWHYYADGRTYHETKTEISQDGVNWIPLFDSAVSGEYTETTAGQTYSLSPTLTNPVYSAVAVELTIEGLGELTVEVTGYEYKEAKRKITERSASLLAGEVPQIAELSDNKLMTKNTRAVVTYVLEYYQHRIKQNFDYWDNPAIQAGDYIDVQTIFDSARSGIVERQEITFAPNLRARLEVTG